jgi:CubicO group peptidase (beta-lactamase class C family)
MRIVIVPLLLMMLGPTTGMGQATLHYADSIRKAHRIPELAYAVVSADSVYEMQTLGYKRINSNTKAEINDRFRIGSNTKAITGFIAAMLVHEGKISWQTQFFDLFPELKKGSNRAHYKLTLQQLLTFRTRLYSYTYTYPRPTQGQFTGNEQEQRYQFTKWFLQQPLAASDDSINFSNLGYVVAGLMMEKVSGKSYKELVLELGTRLDINFGFGQPNTSDKLQPWGHNENLEPEPPGDNYKLGWLLPAGNINVNLPDYAKFIQLQLRGLQGKSELLTQSEFNFLHYGTSRWAAGWLWNQDEQGYTVSYNVGNPGTFLSKVYVYKEHDRAYIMLSHLQSEQADEGLDLLYTELRKRYNRAK